MSLATAFSGNLGASAKFGLIVAATLTAIAIACGDYSVTVEKFWGLKKATTTVTLAPTLISTLTAVFVILPVMIRCTRHAMSSLSGIVLFLLNTALCATFVSLFFGNGVWNIPFINMNSQTFMIICILFSWLGMRVVAGFMWVFLFFISMTRLVTIDQAMGGLGSIYILCAAASIFIQLGDMGRDVLSSLKSDFAGISDTVRKDVLAASDAAAHAARTVAAHGLPGAHPTRTPIGGGHPEQ